MLDRAVSSYPEHAPTIAARGVLLARLGRREKAVKDQEQALSIDSSAPTMFQVAGIYALLSPQQPDGRRRAISLLLAALQKGFGEISA